MIDTENSNQTLSIDAHVMAEKGIMSFQVQFYHPSSNEEINIDCPINSTSKPDYPIQYNKEIKKNSNPGTWKLRYIKIVDSSGNVRYLKQEDIAKKGFPTEFQVKMGWLARIYVLVLYQLIFFGALAFFYVATMWKREANVKRGFLGTIRGIYEGSDKSSSTSKFQFFLWTAIAFWAYIAILSDRIFMHGEFDPIVQIPENLILAMGLSTTTMLAAKGITSSYSDQGLVAKSTVDQEKAKSQIKGGLFLDDDGNPDLSKIQVLGWTFIAAAIFILSTWNAIRAIAVPQGLPDIDSSVLWLMGIGQGAYIGKKLVTKEDPNAPRLDAVLPKEGKKGDLIKITGANFGASKGKLLVGDKSYPDTTTGLNLEWTQNVITFNLIDGPDGKPLGPSIKFGLIVGDKRIENDLPFTVIK